MTQAERSEQHALIVRLFRSGSPYLSLCRRFGRRQVDKALRAAL